MNSKKKTIADVKAGRIYRCINCDKKCNDDLSSEAFTSGDVYMGRIDQTKVVTEHYCSRSCMTYYYRQEVGPSIERYDDIFEYKLGIVKAEYKRRLLRPIFYYDVEDVGEECSCGKTPCECRDNEKEDIEKFVTDENKKQSETYAESLEELKLTLLFLAQGRRFFKACLERKSEYELYELQLKAMHLAGPLIECVHANTEALNTVLGWHGFIKCIVISSVTG